MAVNVENYLIELFKKNISDVKKFEVEFKRKLKLLEQFETSYVNIISDSLDKLLDRLLEAIARNDRMREYNTIERILVKGSKNDRKILYAEHKKSMDIIFNIIKKDVTKSLPKVKKIWKLYMDSINEVFKFIMENKEIIKSYKKNKKFDPVKEVRFLRDRYNGLKQYIRTPNPKIVELLLNIKAFTGKDIKNIMPEIEKIMSTIAYNRAIMNQDRR
jgi:hypothetical protein